MTIIDWVDPISLALMALLSALTVASGFAIRWLVAKTGAQLLEETLKGVASAAHLAVQEVWATYAKALKDAAEDGSLTAEEKRLARSMAIDLLKSYVGAKGWALIAREAGMDEAVLNGLLGATVESALRAEKRVDRLTTPNEARDG